MLLTLHRRAALEMSSLGMPQITLHVAFQDLSITINEICDVLEHRPFFSPFRLPLFYGVTRGNGASAAGGYLFQKSPWDKVDFQFPREFLLFH